MGDRLVSAKVVNLILFAYQMALIKTIGKSAGAMAQLLISELGDLLSKSLEVEAQSLEEAIKKLFKETGLANDVEFKQVDEKTYEVIVKDSAFKELHEMLKKEGLKDFPLSPEAMLVASIIRKYLRHYGDGRERVLVKTSFEGDYLKITVKQLKSL